MPVPTDHPKGPSDKFLDNVLLKPNDVERTNSLKKLMCWLALGTLCLRSAGGVVVAGATEQRAI